MIHRHIISLAEHVDTTVQINTAHKQLKTGRTLASLIFNTTSLNDVLDPKGDYAQGLMLPSGNEASEKGPIALRSNKRFATFVHFVTDSAKGMLWGYHYDPNNTGLLVVEGFSQHPAGNQEPAIYRTWQLSRTKEHGPDGRGVDCVDVKYRGTPDALTDMNHEEGDTSLWSPANKVAGVADYIKDIVGLLIDPSRQSADSNVGNHFTESVLHNVYNARARA